MAATSKIAVLLDDFEPADRPAVVAAVTAAGEALARTRAHLQIQLARYRLLWREFMYDEPKVRCSWRLHRRKF
jgi:hypothetical protein